MQRTLRAPTERSGSLHSPREEDQVALKLRSDFREFCRGWVGWGFTCGGLGGRGLRGLASFRVGLLCARSSTL